MRGLPALISVLATLLVYSASVAARDPPAQRTSASAVPAARAAAATAPTDAASEPGDPGGRVASTSGAMAPEELKQMEASLLALFGLKKRPRPNRARAVVPEAMMELWRRQQPVHGATSRLRLPDHLTLPANTVRSFTHVESAVDATFSGHHRFRLAFDVKSIPAGETLKAADLHLSRQASEAGLTGAQRVLVHDVVRPGNRRRGRDPILRLLDSRVVRPAANSSLVLDVSPAVQRWLQHPRSNHGLLVEVFPEKGTTEAQVPHPLVRLRRDVGEHDDDWLPVQPVLIAFTDDGKAPTAKHSRTRRAAPSKRHNKAGKRDHCRRYPLYVDFADVGWNDWIVAPPGYDAFYCHGECPFPLSDHLNSTNHAIVQTLMHSVKPSVPQACCVPTALTSISMLYLDETDKVVLKNYQEMAVVGCGCR